MNFLHSVGADIHAPGPRGYTAIFAASQNGHLAVLKSLAKMGFDLTKVLPSVPLLCTSLSVSLSLSLST